MDGTGRHIIVIIGGESGIKATISADFWFASVCVCVRES